SAEIVPRLTHRFGLGEASAANGRERLERLVQYAAQLLRIGKPGIQILPPHGARNAIFETTIERNLLPPTKESVCGIVALWRPVGRENEFGKRNELERIFELVFG